MEPMHTASETGRRHVIRDGRVLVAGGAGFIGSHVVDLLMAERAAGVVVIDDLSSGARENLAAHAGDRRLRVVTADIRDIESVVAAMRGIDLVLHFASLPLDRTLASPRECFEVMIDGAVNLLEAAIDARVKKVVVASCASVYGRPGYRPVDEDHPLRARNAYAAAKIAAEQVARAYHHMYGIDIVMLRYFRVYGPRMTAQGWPGASTDPAARPVQGREELEGVDLVHVRDAARAALLALGSPAEDRVWNIASGVEGTNERARLELGWKPQTTLETAVSEATAQPAGA